MITILSDQFIMYKVEPSLIGMDKCDIIYVHIFTLHTNLKL